MRESREGVRHQSPHNTYHPHLAPKIFKTIFYVNSLEEKFILHIEVNHGILISLFFPLLSQIQFKTVETIPLDNHAVKPVARFDANLRKPWHMQ